MSDNFLRSLCFGLACTAFAFTIHTNAHSKENPLLTKLQKLSQSKVMSKTISNSNTQYQKYSPQQKRALAREYKKELKSKEQPFIAHLTKSRSAKRLAQFQKANPAVLGLVLTNATGYSTAQSFNPKRLRQTFTRKLLASKNPSTKVSTRAKSPFKTSKVTRIIIPIIQNKVVVGSLLAYLRRT